jgi:hypothetical protein
MKKKSKGRTILFLTVRTILFILLAIYALLNVYGYRFDETTQGIKKTGVIEIRAYPSHLNVQLDGEIKSDQSPYEIREVDLGTHNLVLSQQGFFPLEKIVQVEDLFVVRFGHLFLVPDNIFRFGQIVLDAFDRRFTVGDSVFFLLEKQKVLVQYNTQSGEWHSYDIPFEGTIKTLLARGNDHMVIQTDNAVYDIALPRFVAYKIPLTHFPTSLQVDPTNTNALLYISDTTLYKYVLTSHTEDVFVHHVSSFVLTPARLYYCSPEHKMFEQDMFSIGTSNNLPVLSSVLSCPLRAVMEVDNHTMVYTGTQIFVDDVKIDNMVQSPPVLLQGTILSYVVGGSLYRYDVTEDKRDLVNRFMSSIPSWTTGPDNDHLFITSGSDLYFCDIKNIYCQKMFSGKKPLSWIFYQPDQKYLMIQYGQSIYRFDFSFWK